MIALILAAGMATGCQSEAGPRSDAASGLRAPGDPSGSSAGAGGQGVPAIDHITVAVRDLGAAGRLFASLGFSLKPGRPHANSIENLHVKFADGTELELLTATEPRDALAQEYLERIAAGDGGAFVALRHPDLEAFGSRLAELGRETRAATSIGLKALTFPRSDVLRPVWFIEMAEPVIDEPAITTHENGATALIAVWLAGPAAAAFRDMARALGMTATETARPRSGSTEIGLSRGSLYAVEGSEESASSVAGATIAVRDLERAARIIDRAGVRYSRRTDASGSSLRIAPGVAHGIWLELLEPSTPIPEEVQ